MSSDQSVRAVDRAISILECFTVDAPELSFTSIAAGIGLSKSTTHRLLSTLQRSGMVEFDDEKAVFRLGRAVLRLGSVAACGMDLVRQARPILAALAQVSDETALLLIPDDSQALCVYRFEGSHPGQSVALEPGRRVPLNCGAAPRVLLAHLPEPLWRVIVSGGLEPLTRYSLTSEDELERDRQEITQRGYAMGWEDVSLHTCDVAAPIFNAKDDVIGAVSISGIVQRFSAERLPTLIRSAMEAGGEISRALGQTRPVSSDAAK